jgi:predicted dehydrogenase
MGSIHAFNLNRFIPKSKLKVVCDINKYRAKYLASKYKVEYTLNYKEILKREDIDAVIVASSIESHGNLLIDSIKSKKHIFCEKPPCLNLNEANECIRLSKETEASIQIGFMRRFDHSYRNAKNILLRKKIGKPILIRSITRDPKHLINEEKFSKINNILFDTTIHDIDIVCWLIGSEVASIYAIAEKVEFDGIIDNIVVILRFLNGSIATIYSSLNSIDGYDVRTDVFGSNGIIEINNYSNVLSQNQYNNINRSFLKSWYYARFHEAYVYEMKSFIRSISNGLQTYVNLYEGIKSLRITLAAFKSIEKHTAITFTD